MNRAGILLFDGVEELDAIGPWEVLSAWSLQFPEDGWEVALCAAEAGPVTAAKTAVFTPHEVRTDDYQLIVVPGGQGTRRILREPATLEWVRAAH